MAWIEQQPEKDAAGLLAKIYKDAVQRSGKVWNILKIMSLNPRQLRASMGLYASLVHLDSALSARMRQTLAVVVSRANDCHY